MKIGICHLPTGTLGDMAVSNLSRATGLPLTDKYEGHIRVVFVSREFSSLEDALEYGERLRDHTLMKLYVAAAICVTYKEDKFISLSQYAIELEKRNATLEEEMGRLLFLHDNELRTMKRNFETFMELNGLSGGQNDKPAGD